MKKLILVVLVIVSAASAKKKTLIQHLRELEGVPDDYDDSNDPCTTGCTNEEFRDNEIAREYCLFLCQVAQSDIEIERMNPGVNDIFGVGSGAGGEPEMEGNDDDASEKHMKALPVKKGSRCDDLCSARDQLSGGQIQYCDAYCNNPEDDEEKLLAEQHIVGRGDDYDYEVLSDQQRNEREARICREECTKPHKSLRVPCKKNCGKYLNPEELKY